MRQHRHFWHFLTSVRSVKQKKRREWVVGAGGWPKHWLCHQFAWLLKPAVLNLHNSFPPLQTPFKNEPQQTKTNQNEPHWTTAQHGPHLWGQLFVVVVRDVVVVVAVSGIDVVVAAAVVVLLCVILCLFAFRTRMRDIFVSAVESVFLILFSDFVFWFGFFFLSNLCVFVFVDSEVCRRRFATHRTNLLIFDA